MHFDSEALIEYADGVSAYALEIEAHAAECALCAGGIEETRALMIVLADRATWPSERTDVLAVAEHLDAERESAAAVCDAMLSAPPAWRAQHARSAAGRHVAGFVMELLARMRTTLEKDPQRTLEMTGLAVALAMTFDRDLYPDSLIANLQGQALRDHAFVFSFIGLHREALEYGERADALFEMVPAAAFERDH